MVSRVVVGYWRAEFAMLRVVGDGVPAIGMLPTDSPSATVDDVAEKSYRSCTSDSESD